MNKKIFTKSAALLGLVSLLNLSETQAQDIHFTQFNSSPLTVNPAFTGGFSGTWRAAAIYRNQWNSVTTPFVTYGASFDLPVVHNLSQDDYLAVGAQLYNDRSGDGNLNNFSGLLSVAYHKFLGTNLDKVLSFGVQGGYTQKSIDLSKLYFGDEFINGNFQPGTTGEQLTNRVNYMTINAGLSWSHRTGERFGYQLGVGANNLNQPKESFMKQKNKDVGLGMRYTGQLGAIWQVSNRFSLRPGALYQYQSSAQELVAGNEFHVIVGDYEIPSVATGLFLGAWYRNNDAIMATAGIEFKGFRVGVAYDYNISDLSKATKNYGGFEIALRYIAPDPMDFARKVLYPCQRF
jgi:type IX secretion system PorP/SprF family membrane protein